MCAPSSASCPHITSSLAHWQLPAGACFSAHLAIRQPPAQGYTDADRPQRAGAPQGAGQLVVSAGPGADRQLHHRGRAPLPLPPVLERSACRRVCKRPLQHVGLRACMTARQRPCTGPPRQGCMHMARSCSWEMIGQEKRQCSMRILTL